MEWVASAARAYEPWLKRAAKFLLVATLAVPLVFGNSFFFPFIVPKYLLFRTLVELLGLVYLALLVGNVERYRPRMNLASWGMLAYVASAVASGLVGNDWHASFYGTFERMEGIFTTLHYAALFVVLPCLFSRRDWPTLLRWSVLISVALSAYGLAQHFGASWTIEAGRDRISATIGNPAYVAAYLLFQMGFAAYLAAADWSKKLRWLWLVSLAVQLVTFVLTLTRGAMLGLAISLPVTAFAWLWLTRGTVSRRARRWVAGAAIAVVALPALAVALRSSPLVSGTPLLQRFADISPAATTAKTRFLTWGAAWQGIVEKPILGWGPEQFMVAFNRHTSPLHYTGPNSETWFDHAHNIVLDTLATQGAVGLLAWLAFVVGLVAAAWRAARDANRRSLGLAAVGILVAYLLQNLFLFDVLVVWLMLAVLGGVLLCRGDDSAEPAPTSRRLTWGLLAGTAAYVAALAAFAMPLNWRTGHLSRTIILAKGADINPAAVEAQLDIFEQQVLDRPIGTGDGEAARMMANSVLYHVQSGDYAQDSALRDRALQLAVSALAGAWQRHPGDLQTGLSFAKMTAVRGEVARDPRGYQDAIAIVNVVRAASPDRIEPLLDLSLYQMASGDASSSIATGLKAASMVPDVAYVKWTLGVTYARAKMLPEAARYMEDALRDPVLAGHAYEQGSQIQRLIDVYIGLQEWPKLAAIYQQVLQIHPDSAEAWGSLAMTYQKLGEYDAGIAAASRAIELEPRFAEPANALIKELEAAKRRQKKR